MDNVHAKDDTKVTSFKGGDHGLISKISALVVLQAGGYIFQTMVRNTKKHKDLKKDN